MALNPPSMTISYTKFMKLCEVYDKDVMGRSQVRQTGEGGRLYPSKKKSAAEKRRVKAIGGGKTAPAKDYKPRKDIGVQGAGRGTSSKREQQPEKERGSASLSPREQQRKARAERMAAKSGAKTKTASELLAKKTKKTVDPKYNQVKASGMTQKERDTLRKKGERKLRDLRLQATGKTKESELKYPVTTKEVNRRNKKK